MLQSRCDLPKYTSLWSLSEPSEIEAAAKTRSGDNRSELWVPLSFIFIQMMQFYSPRSHLQETWFWQRCDFTISRMSPDYSRACADFYLQSLSSLITLLKLNPTHWQWCSQKRSIMILTPHKKYNSSLKTLQDKRKHKQHRVTGMNKILWGQFGRFIDQ